MRNWYLWKKFTKLCIVFDLFTTDLSAFKTKHELKSYDLQSIFRQLLNSVMFLHSKNIAHLDIKPRKRINSLLLEHHY